MFLTASFLVIIACIVYLALRPFEWKEFEASAVEQDSRTEVFKVSEPTRTGFDQLNFGVDAFYCRI